MGWDDVIRWEIQERGHERLSIIVPRLVRHYFLFFLIAKILISTPFQRGF